MQRMYTTIDKRLQTEHVACHMQPLFESMRIKLVFEPASRNANHKQKTKMWNMDLHAIVTKKTFFTSLLFSGIHLCISCSMLLCVSLAKQMRFQLSHSLQFVYWNEVHSVIDTEPVTLQILPTEQRRKNVQKQILTFSRSPFLQSITFITNPPLSILIHRMLSAQNVHFINSFKSHSF